MKPISKFYLGLVVAFLYAPIAVLILFSFNANKSRGVWTGFTLDWYRRLFSNEMILTSLLNTLIIALIASIVATVIGTMAAVGISRMRKAPRAVVLNITYLPMINPEIVTGVSLMLLFVSFQGIVQALNRVLGTAFVFEFGLLTLILAHITFNVPYVILSVMPKLRQMDKNVYDAALDLGCSPMLAFFKVVIPEIMPGIVSGFLMAVTFSIDDFIISYFTSGPTSQTLPITIFSMTRRKVSPEINALSTLIFLVVVTILIINNVRAIRHENRNKKNSRVVSFS